MTGEGDDPASLVGNGMVMVMLGRRSEWNSVSEKSLMKVSGEGEVVVDS